MDEKLNFRKISMNEKLSFQIVDFMNSVIKYVRMEYNPKYYRELTKDNSFATFFDFIGSYYMGGANVPDVARYVVDLIKMNER